MPVALGLQRPDSAAWRRKKPVPSVGNLRSGNPKRLGIAHVAQRSTLLTLPMLMRLPLLSVVPALGHFAECNGGLRNSGASCRLLSQVMHRRCR